MASITDDNWVVWNQGKNPLVNFNFMLRVELVYDLPCKSVRAFSRELEYDYIQEGGLNDYVHMLRKPISKPFTLEVERYVGVDYMDPLPLGADLVLPVLLFVSRAHDQFIPGVVARTYVFTGCTVMKKEYGELSGDRSGLLVETTTLGYREMLCVDIPWSEVGDNISGSTPQSPTQAVTVDKTAEELKALGQSLYEKAKAAKEQSDDEYKKNDADALLTELETTLTKLQKAIDEKGSLGVRLAAAQKGIYGPDGETTKKALADKAYDDARKAESDTEEAEEALRKAKDAGRKAQDEAQAYADQLSTAQKQLSDLDDQLEAANKDKTALEEKLGEDQSVDAAQEALTAAKAAYKAAEQAVKEARAELEKGRNATGQKRRESAAIQATAKRETAQHDCDAQSEKLENLKASQQEAEEKVKQTEQAAQEAAEKAAQATEEAAEQAQKDAQQAQSEHTAAQAEVARLKNEISQAEADLETAKQNLESAKESEEAAIQATTTGMEELQQAEEARNQAKKALDDASTRVQDAKDLAELKTNIPTMEEQRETTNQQVNDLDENKLPSAKAAVTAAQADIDAAQKKYETAAKAWKDAQGAVATARKDAEEAEQELSEAQSLVTRGTTQAQQLQNSQINLKLRIERGTQAQEDCTTQHSLCKTANDELQALPDTDVVPVNTAYEQVKTLFKQTTYYERQVRESSQYMKAVQKQLGDVIDLPKETTEETPDNNTEPQIDLGEAPVLPET